MEPGVTRHFPPSTSSPPLSKGIEHCVFSALLSFTFTVRALGKIVLNIKEKYTGGFRRNNRIFVILKNLMLHFRPLTLRTIVYSESFIPLKGQ